MRAARRLILAGLMQITRRLGVGVGILALVALVACSSGGGGGGDGTTASSLDAFIAQYCDVYQPCCARAQKPYDPNKCRAFVSAFVAQGATYDAARGQGCLDAARAEAQTGAFCDSGLSDAASAKCQGVISTSGNANGTKKPGDLCESDGECAPSPDGDVDCASSFANGATTRKCQVRARGKAGEACVGVRDGNATITSGTSVTDGPAPRVTICRTADGLFCDGKTKTCLRQENVGGGCASLDARACVDAAYCDRTTKLCAARKAQGDACSATTEECAERLFCDDVTDRCAPTLATGAACTRSKECEKGSCTNGKCSGGSSTSTALFCAQ